MADFRELSLSECCELLLSVENPLVAMHIRPDGDTVGSGAALCEIFKQLGKNPKYACHDDIPERLAFLIEGYERTDNFDGLTPVAIDVASPAQLGGLYERLTPLFSIDHHKMNTPFCDNFTLSCASSAGEVLLDLARVLVGMGRLTITKRIAECIYAAISSDTGGFAYSNASAKAYRDAADLISLGIDHADINKRLFDSKSKTEIIAEGFVGSRLNCSDDGKIAYAVISKKEREAIGLPFTAFDTAIDVVRALRGSEVAFVVKETDKGEFKASLRSTGVNVAEIAARHSGGGHIRAAGCAVIAECAEAAAEILLNELKAVV